MGRGDKRSRFCAQSITEKSRQNLQRVYPCVWLVPYIGGRSSIWITGRNQTGWFQPMEHNSVSFPFYFLKFGRKTSKVSKWLHLACTLYIYNFEKHCPCKDPLSPDKGFCTQYNNVNKLQANSKACYVFPLWNQRKRNQSTYWTSSQHWSSVSQERRTKIWEHISNQRESCHQMERWEIDNWGSTCVFQQLFPHFSVHNN